MSDEELEQLMRAARDYPTTGTIDALCRAVRETIAELRAQVRSREGITLWRYRAGEF